MWSPSSRDINFELELQTGINEKSKTWQPINLSKLKDLHAATMAKRDSAEAALGKGPTITAGQLEKQAFEVALTALKHDTKLYHAWCGAQNAWTARQHYIFRNSNRLPSVTAGRVRLLTMCLMRSAALLGIEPSSVGHKI